jgi:hypothetical protein
MSQIEMFDFRSAITMNLEKYPIVKKTQRSEKTYTK